MGVTKQQAIIAIAVAAVGLSVVAGLALRGRSPFRGVGRGLTGKHEVVESLPATDLELPRTLLTADNRICSRDLVFAERLCEERQGSERDAKERKKLRSTLDFLQTTLDQHPQVIWYQLKEDSGKAYLAPIYWHDQVSVKTEESADVVIVGGELSSLCTAVEAAERGFKVVVVYSGPLGGLSSDTGGNLRFFDNINPTSHPTGQKKVFLSGLGMHEWTNIPRGVDKRLRRFFANAYGSSIKLVQTASYDSLHVTVADGRVAGVLTDEGVQVSGTYYLDMDPEARLAEKAGLPMDIDTPHLSYGVCFDVAGLAGRDWQALESHALLSPEQIAKLAGLGSIDKVIATEDGDRSYKFLRIKLEHDRFEASDSLSYRYGYSALAAGFDFYMRCLAVRQPSEDLTWLNQRRKVSGFNIAINDGSACFNSLSYLFLRNIMQHSHDLTKEQEFAALGRVEMPAMQRYLTYVTGDKTLRVRMPSQFYVRKATAFFKALHPYIKSEFNHKARTRFYTTYPMDLRDLQARDPQSWPKILGYTKVAKGMRHWDCRASAAETQIPNLYLICKCGITPTFSGGLRIEQNQINMGAAVVAGL